MTIRTSGPQCEFEQASVLNEPTASLDLFHIAYTDDVTLIFDSHDSLNQSSSIGLGLSCWRQTGLSERIAYLSIKCH